jgi:DNA-directed RNA polymerase specialized sigma24 family protein
MPTPDTTLSPAREDQESLRRVRDVLRQLRPAEKEVFLLRQNDGLEYERIAEIVRRPLAVVKTQMRAALGVLRQALA